MKCIYTRNTGQALFPVGLFFYTTMKAINAKTSTSINKSWGDEVKIYHKPPIFKNVEHSEVKETSEYNAFQFDVKNRPVSEEKVHFFMKQFENGKFFMRDFPAIVDKDFVILDGQHRVEACRRKMLPVFFRFALDLTLDKVTDVQINAGWKPTDYLHAFIQQKNQNYIILNRFIKRYNVSVQVAVTLLSKNEGNRVSLKSSGYYDGTFTVSNEERAHKEAKLISEIGELALKLHRDRTFCLAVIRIAQHPEYDHKRMISQLEKYSSLIHRQMTVDSYIRNLEDIYNYKLFSKNKVRFI